MKKWLIKGLSLLNVIEGFIHIGVALIGLWGAFSLGVWDWRILIAPVENLFFGLFSLLTGYVLGTDFHHHGHGKG